MSQNFTRSSASLAHSLVSEELFRLLVEEAIREERSHLVDALISAARDGNTTTATRLSGQIEQVESTLSLFQLAAKEHIASVTEGK
jgi:hypothetical protein